MEKKNGKMNILLLHITVLSHIHSFSFVNILSFCERIVTCEGYAMDFKSFVSLFSPSSTTLPLASQPTLSRVCDRFYRACTSDQHNRQFRRDIQFLLKTFQLAFFGTADLSVNSHTFHVQMACHNPTAWDIFSLFFLVQQYARQ